MIFLKNKTFMEFEIGNLYVLLNNEHSKYHQPGPIPGDIIQMTDYHDDSMWIIGNSFPRRFWSDYGFNKKCLLSLTSKLAKKLCRV